MDSSNSDTLAGAYSVHNLLNTFRNVPNNPNLADYTTTATIIDEDGNEYDFTHSHSNDVMNGRHLPRDIYDCPRPGSTIDPHTGECTDICHAEQDCAAGYTCASTHLGQRCLRQVCKDDADCDTGQCSQGLCQPLRCDDETPVPTYTWTSNDVNTDFTADEYGQPPCVSTSHYHLKGKILNIDISKDPRYAGMY